MGRMQRNKGARWERTVVNRLREAGWEAQRMAPMQTATNEHPDVRACFDGGCGAQGCDIDRTHFAIECKVGQRVRYQAALDQARESAGPGDVPMVIAKIDRTPPVVVLELDAFLELVR